MKSVLRASHKWRAQVVRHSDGSCRARRLSRVEKVVSHLCSVSKTWCASAGSSNHHPPNIKEKHVAGLKFLASAKEAEVAGLHVVFGRQPEGSDSEE